METEPDAPQVEDRVFLDDICVQGTIIEITEWGDEQAAIIEFDEPYGDVTHATFLLSDFFEAEEESLH